MYKRHKTRQPKYTVRKVRAMSRKFERLIHALWISSDPSVLANARQKVREAQLSYEGGVFFEAPEVLAAVYPATFELREDGKWHEKGGP